MIYAKKAFNSFKGIVRPEKRGSESGTIRIIMASHTIAHVLGTLKGLLSCLKLQKTGLIVKAIKGGIFFGTLVMDLYGPCQLRIWTQYSYLHVAAGGL
jgi:hypothetical protein